MRIRVAIVAMLLITAVAAGSVPATADGGGRRFQTSLDGYQEVPTLSVDGVGSFSAELGKGGTSISFTLQYSGLTGDATAAHIHLGRPATSGGPIAFLCGGGGHPACPTGTSATITGIIDATHVVGPTTQGIEAGDFAELVAALQAGATYVNVHTVAFPPGEIRGDIA